MRISGVIINRFILFLLIITVLYIISRKRDNFSDINAETNIISPSSNSGHIPKKIWVIWDKPEELTTELVKLCYKSMRKMAPDYQFIQVNLINYKNYVDDERVISIIDNKNIPINYKSDLLRLYLVNKYGGIYIDSSSLVLDNFDWVQEIFERMTSDIIMFKNPHHTQDQNKPVLESWFIASKPNQDFLRITMDIFIEILSSKDIKRSFNAFRQKVTNCQNFCYHGAYHAVYYVFIYVITTMEYKSKITFLDFTDYNYMFIYRWGEMGKFVDLYSDVITEERYHEILNNTKFIKYTNYVRNYVEKLNIVRDSFIYRFINDLN